MTITLSVIITFVNIFFVAQKVIAHASDMTCDKTLFIGADYMGGGATLGSESIIVMRGSTLLTSNSKYIAGEILTVSFTNPSMEYIIDTDKGTFTGSNVDCSN